MCHWKWLAFPFTVTLAMAGIIFVFSGDGCEGSLQHPMAVVSGLLFAVPLIAVLFVCSRNPVVIWIYLFVMLLTFALLLFFLVFTLKVVNSDGDGNKGEEFRIEDYSNWLRKKVDAGEEWNGIRRCVVDTKICGRRSSDASFSPMWSGCCKPPSECGFVHKGNTVWDKPATGSITSNNTDCAAWGNDRNVLCYDCQSCKAAILELSKGQWEFIADLSLSVLALYAFVLICVFISYYCALIRERKTPVHTPDWNDNALPVPVNYDRYYGPYSACYRFSIIH